MSKTDIFREINEERKSQDLKWGDQGYRSREEWFVILFEELGEACRAHLKGANANCRLELIEAAAVIVAMLEYQEKKGGGG